MGALGITLRVEGSGDLEKLNEEALTLMVDWLKGSFDSDAYEKLTWYLSEARYHDSWGPDEGALYWVFPDGGGNCTRSKYLWVHWTRLAVAARWDELDALAKGYGYRLAGERWTFADARTDSFVELRGTLWMIMDDVLHTDGRGMDVAELDPDERRVAEAARAACACAPCRMLRAS